MKLTINYDPEDLGKRIQVLQQLKTAALKAGLHESAGLAGADGIRAYIDAHIPPPNSPITVEGGWMYNRQAKKSFYVPGKGLNKPLFDTGALYNAFNYEIDPN